MTVLRTAGHEPGIHLPFEALGRLLLPLLASPHHADRETVHALRTALEAAARPGARLEVALATWRLLTNHAARTPVAAVIDDARWLDRPTADVLAFLARRINRARVLLLTTDDHRADGRDQDEKGACPACTCESSTRKQQGLCWTRSRSRRIPYTALSSSSRPQAIPWLCTNSPERSPTSHRSPWSPRSSCLCPPRCSGSMEPGSRLSTRTSDRPCSSQRQRATWTGPRSCPRRTGAPQAPDGRRDPRSGSLPKRRAW